MYSLLQHLKINQVHSLVKNISKCTLCSFFFLLLCLQCSPYTANLCGYRQLRKFSAISASMLKLFFYRPSSLKQLYLWFQGLLRQQSL